MHEYIDVQHLSTFFPVKQLGKKGVVKAVQDVTFTIPQGETLGIVGESGCGKSTLGRTLVRIYEPTSGKFFLNGQDVMQMKGQTLKDFRRNVQMIFQDPYASLNPRMTVGEMIREPMEIHHVLHTTKERDERVAELLMTVGLKPDHIRRYPHEFSGGQRQRISIARTLALNPSFIICDEPISALDVSIQAQIMNLLRDVQKRLNMTYLFIAHDIGMVQYISDRIGVMYLGHLMEIGDSKDIFFHPMHPYTQALISAIPIPDPEKAKASQRVTLQGELPSPLNPPKGCPFVTRCPRAQSRCHETMPELKTMNHRSVACFAVEDDLKESSHE